MSDWEPISKEFGYEGAAAILCNANHEILFLLSEKDGNLQAEMPGGKPERMDGGDPKQTAIREMREETGIELTVEDLSDVQLKTIGGTTGCPSIQFLTKPMDVHPTKLESKFVRSVWSKIYHPSPKEWYVESKIPIRKFNTFFLTQNEVELKAFIAEQ